MALKEGLSESTVLDIFKKKGKAQQREIGRGDGRVLGVDEIAIRKGHKQYAWVLMDIERRCVLEVWDNRRQATVEGWVVGLSDQQKRAINVVSMDMWNPYRYAVRRQVPKAQIIAARFHVVKQLNQQLDLWRRKLRRQAPDRVADLVKGSRWLLLKNRANLSPKAEKKLALILAASVELGQTDLLKEEFRTICDRINDKHQAEPFLRAWCYKAEATACPY